MGTVTQLRTTVEDGGTPKAKASGPILGQDDKHHAWATGTRCICGQMVAEGDTTCFNGAVDLNTGAAFWQSAATG